MRLPGGCNGGTRVRDRPFPPPGSRQDPGSRPPPAPRPTKNPGSRLAPAKTAVAPPPAPTAGAHCPHPAAGGAGSREGAGRAGEQSRHRLTARPAATGGGWARRRGRGRAALPAHPLHHHPPAATVVPPPPHCPPRGTAHRRTPPPARGGGGLLKGPRRRFFLGGGVCLKGLQRWVPPSVHLSIPPPPAFCAHQRCPHPTPWQSNGGPVGTTGGTGTGIAEKTPSPPPPQFYQFDQKITLRGVLGDRFPLSPPVSP